MSEKFFEKVFENVDNESNGLITKVWGNETWEVLYSIAANYPNNPNNKTKKRYLIFFYVLGYVLPCNICDHHYLKLITNKKHEKTYLCKNVMENRDTLLRWIFNVKKKIDKRLGFVYPFNYGDLKKRLDSYRAKCYPNNFHNNQMNLDLSILGSNINYNESNQIIPIDYKRIAYKNYYNKKEYQIIPLKLVEKIYQFAKKNKLFTDDYFAFYNWFKSTEINCNYKLAKKYDLWNTRNKACGKIIKQMRINSIPSHINNILSLVEINLILYLCSNISLKELDFVIEKTIFVGKPCEFTLLDNNE